MCSRVQLRAKFKAGMGVKAVSETLDFYAPFFKITVRPWGRRGPFDALSTGDVVIAARPAALSLGAGRLWHVTASRIVGRGCFASLTTAVGGRARQGRARVRRTGHGGK